MSDKVVFTLLAVAAAAFVTVFVAEFGDKTQLVSMAMACRYPPLQVLAGAMIALSAAIGMAVAVGGILAAYIPHQPVAIASGAVFILIGVVSYLRREKVDNTCSGRDGFWQTMGLVFVAEFGDKTQLAAMFLAAGSGYPLAVFGGAMAAMLANHLLAVFVGSRLVSKINPRLLKLLTAALFVLVGLIILVFESGLIAR